MQGVLVCLTAPIKALTLLYTMRIHVKVSLHSCLGAVCQTLANRLFANHLSPANGVTCRVSQDKVFFYLYTGTIVASKGVTVRPN